jgi:methionyl-tRNA formyltransferase
MFNPEYRKEPFLRVSHLAKIARRYNVQYLQSPGGNIHHAEFLKRIDELKPSLGISCFVLKIYKPELLKRFSGIVNYHNGLLPFYKGLRATPWSRYKGEDRTGYAFHWMDESIDTGPVLLQDSIALSPGSSIVQLEIEKIRHAARHISTVLSMMYDRHKRSFLRGYSAGKEYRTYP